VKTDLVYLKENVIAEPLICGWYAWSHLICPATVGFNIKNRLIKIMKSYIQDPQSHVNACNDPGMTGGPFIDLNGENIEGVKKLLVRTVKETSHLIAFATALEKLDKMLTEEASGFSLNDMYKKIPEPLKGYVELFYDLHNRASYRLIEPLLYKSKFYDDKLQSLMIYEINDDNRPFVLSTPKLENENSLSINTHFSDNAIDELFKMKREAQSYKEIRSLFDLDEQSEEKFKNLFTTEKPKFYHKYTGNSVRTRYFGHACILIETSDTSILIDPVISYEYEVDLPRFTYADLPDEIDFVLITHNHQDHVLLETMLQLRNKVKNWIVPRNSGHSLLDPSLKLMMNNIGFNNVIEVNDLDTIHLSACNIHCLPFFGEHGDLEITSKTGYLIETKNYKIMCLADTRNVEHKLFDHLTCIYGEIDVLFIGMECNGAPVSWLYGQYLPEALSRENDVSRSIEGSDYDAAINIVDCFKPKEAYVYAMGMEPWIKFLSANIYTPECDAIVQSNMFINECKKRGIVSERLYGEKELLQVQEELESTK
jgi:L-ascorbate metabolism protein UlaG (beta-lactamase superfamily)